MWIWVVVGYIEGRAVHGKTKFRSSNVHEGKIGKITKEEKRKNLLIIIVKIITQPKSQQLKK